MSMSSMKSNLDNFFLITARNSSIRTELLAGSYTFLSLSYIFVIHPVILRGAGFEVHSVLAATVFVSVIATFASGLWTGLPFVFAPGLEMSLYLAFVAILMHHLSVRQTLGIAFVTGATVCLLPFRTIKHHLIDRVPHRFPNAVALTMAVFLLTVACSLMGLIDFHKGYLTFTGQSDNRTALIGLGGVLGIIFFEILGVKASVLITVVIVAALSKAQPGPSTETSHLLISVIKPDFISWYADIRAWEAVFVLFVLSCYGSLAKVINLARNTTIEDAHGALPGVRKILFLDGVTTVAGSVMGSTNFTTFVESGVGIAAGGRTGLAAVVTAILMVAGFILRPFIDYVPLTAAVGALVYVGFLFIPKGDSLTAFRRFEFLIIVLMLGITICTLNLGAAFGIGLVGFWVGNGWSRIHESQTAKP